MEWLVAGALVRVWRRVHASVHFAQPPNQHGHLACLAKRIALRSTTRAVHASTALHAACKPTHLAGQQRLGQHRAADRAVLRVQHAVALLRGEAGGWEAARGDTG